MQIEKYSYAQHLHNYAVWTAARAAQRGYVSTAIIKMAIEKSDLRNFAEQNNCTTAIDFDLIHRKIARRIKANLGLLIKEHKPKKLEKENSKSNMLAKTTYGRVAKIIAVYLKTAVLLKSEGKSELSKIMHPPVDAILLNNLHRSEKVNLKSFKFNNYKWTKLEEEEYFIVVNKLREVQKQLAFSAFWQIEKYWQPDQ